MLYKFYMQGMEKMLAKVGVIRRCLFTIPAQLAPDLLILFGTAVRDMLRKKIMFLFHV